MQHFLIFSLSVVYTDSGHTECPYLIQVTGHK